MATKMRLFTEGALEEQKISLGWYFYLRQLTIALPENKLIAWTESINSTLLIRKNNSKRAQATDWQTESYRHGCPLRTPLPELPTRPTSSLKESERGRITGQMQEGSGINVTFSGNWGKRS